MLGNARPFRTVKSADLIMHKKKIAWIKGNIDSNGIKSEISVQIEGQNRRVKIDGKAIQRSAELHGKLGVVIFTPDDTSMIKLGPETRRRYLDRACYGAEISFIEHYHNYYRTLKQRNYLLKSGLKDGLDDWTEKLAETGSILIRQRKFFVSRLESIFTSHYNRISGMEEKVALYYRPDSGESENEIDRLRSIFEASRQSDIRYGTTTRGPHRDDLQFLINGRQLKTFGSQGQQRSFVLALKMAELDSIQETFGEPPILLLDDMSSELDRQRSGNLLAFIKERGIQSFITTTDTTALPGELLDKSTIYRVEAGKLSNEGKVTR